MFTTPTSYKLIAADLDGALKRIAAQPDVQRESKYYLSKISGIDTVEQFLADDRVYRYAMRAHGLEDMTFGKALMRKALKEGIDDPKSFANSLVDQRFRDFVATFNFARYGKTATTFDRAQQGTVDNYLRQTLEETAGEENEGVRLALYFERKAASIASPYALLADRALLKVTQVALGISPSTGSLEIDRQAEMITKKLDVATLKDPEKLDRFLDRFVALWEIENPSVPTGLAPNFTASAGTSIFDMDLLGRIQNMKLGR